MRSDLRLSLKQRIGATVVFLIILAGIGGSVAFWGGERITHSVEQEQIVADIESVLYVRSLLVAEYLSAHTTSGLQEKREEWQNASARIDTLLAEAQRILPADRYQESLERLIEENKRVGVAFTALAEVHAEDDSERLEGHTSSQEAPFLEDLLVRERMLYTIADGFRKDVSEPLSNTAALMQFLIVGLAGVAIVFLLGVGFYFYRTSIVPLQRLTAFVRKFGEGRLGDTIEMDRADEIGVLADAFNASSRALAEYNHTLRRRQARDEAILENIGEGLVVVDADRRIILVNREAVEVLGWSEEEVVGQPIGKVFPLLKEDGTRIAPNNQPIAQSFKKKREISEEERNLDETFLMVRKDQTAFPVKLTASPLWRGDEVVGAIQIFRDITEARTVERMKSDFISIASHQLRTPLTGIQWVVERILKKESSISEKTQEYLDDIRFSAKRLSELVTVLLNASRIEEGSVAIEPAAVDIPAEIEAFLQEVEPMRASKDVELTFTNNAGELTAETDKSAFRNVLQSLVTNALEYTEKGGYVEVILDVKQKSFKITVKDDGIGIPKESQDKLFRKFSRAENAQRRKPNGTGLGLYIAREAVRLLGGSISFTSVEGRGTKFYVTLPLQTKERKGEKRFA